MNMELTKELFKDIIAYRLSEPGAMGPARTIEFLKRTGESFEIDYGQEETSWEKVKENFEEINGCIFNGPMKNEVASSNTIIIGMSENEENAYTKIRPGWKHFYLDFGNHLVVKNEYYLEFRDIFKGVENIDRTFDWIKIIHKTDFFKRIDLIEKEFYTLMEKDEELMKRIEEINKLPDYKKKMEKAQEKGVQGMCQLLEDEYGIKTTELDLRQCAIRRMLFHSNHG